jgi:predicted ester cyclase
MLTPIPACSLRVRIPRTLLLTGVLLLSLIGGIGHAVAAPTANVALTYRLFDEVLAGGPSTASADLIAADATLLTPEGHFTGPDGFDTFLATLRAPFMDLRFTVGDVDVYGDTVAVRWTMTGRVGGASPAVELTGSSVLEIADGLIVRHGFQYDAIALASQIETAQYTEMELARSGAPGQSAPPVAGVREEPVSAPTVVPGEVTPPNGHPR